MSLKSPLWNTLTPSHLESPNDIDNFNDNENEEDDEENEEEEEDNDDDDEDDDLLSMPVESEETDYACNNMKIQSQSRALKIKKYIAWFCLNGFLSGFE
jgi:hypothetical protein